MVVEVYALVTVLVWVSVCAVEEVSCLQSVELVKRLTRRCVDARDGGARKSLGRDDGSRSFGRHNSRSEVRCDGFSTGCGNSCEERSGFDQPLMVSSIKLEV